jgi:hypothetical protein
MARNLIFTCVRFVDGISHKRSELCYFNGPFIYVLVIILRLVFPSPHFHIVFPFLLMIVSFSLHPLHPSYFFTCLSFCVSSSVHWILLFLSFFISFLSLPVSPSSRPLSWLFFLSSFFVLFLFLAFIFPLFTVLVYFCPLFYFHNTHKIIPISISSITGKRANLTAVIVWGMDV